MCNFTHFLSLAIILMKKKPPLPPHTTWQHHSAVLHRWHLSIVVCYTRRADNNGVMTRVIQQQRVVVQPQPALYQRRLLRDLCQGPEVRGTAEAPVSGLGSCKLEHRVGLRGRWVCLVWILNLVFHVVLLAFNPIRSDKRLFCMTCFFRRSSVGKKG